ncbi:MAG: hypothetical protein ACOCZC_01300 [Halodesulfurarchaeum sp.]
MVTKITLFEPRLEGVQIGPATTENEPTGDLETDAGSAPVTTAAQGRRRLSRARRVLLAALVVAGLAAGLTVSRRLRRRGKGAETDGAEVDAPVIEERAVESK